MKGGRGTKEKRVCVSQRAQIKGNQFTDRNLLWISLEIPIVWTQGRDCFIVVGLSIKSGSDGLGEIHLKCGGMVLQAD